MGETQVLDPLSSLIWSTSIVVTTPVSLASQMVHGAGLTWGACRGGNGGDARSVELTHLVDVSCGGNACVAR